MYVLRVISMLPDILRRRRIRYVAAAEEDADAARGGFEFMRALGYKGAGERD